MDPLPYTMTAAVLGLIAGAVLIWHLVGPLIDKGDRLGIRGFIASIRVEYTAAVAATCVAGSLIMSEHLGFTPCLLCWWQRGFMYPAAAFLVLEVIVLNITGSYSGARFSKPALKLPWGVIAAVVLAVPGMGLSLYHRFVQAQGTTTAFCDPEAPCSAKYFNHFGFISIPTLAAIGFATILFFGIITIRASLRESN